ncbi:MAG TPA: penicillin acylase family protein, partial [Coleofasciculaceae cyanobacterium]
MASIVSISTPLFGLEKTEILWDTWGVPHIYGKDTEGLFQAFGWAQMQSHGDLILRLYGQSRGQAAEYWGEKYLDSDKYVRTMGIPQRASEWYKEQSPAMRQYLDAFASGINQYAQEHADRINDEVKPVLPVSGVDVLAHVQRVIHFTFVVDPVSVANLSPGERSAGSNGWAIAPQHSTNGNAMLLANPHLPWSDLYLWYEAQLTAPEIDAYGVALVGMPVLAIAFNNNLGWTFTVNTHDGWDAYELTLTDGGYRWDNEVKPFETQTQTLKVKQADGTLREEQLVIRQSIHGPVVAQNDGKAIALRVVGLERSHMMEQIWDMARATNLSRFETALEQLQLPMFNILYSDRDGHILYVFNGLV